MSYLLIEGLKFIKKRAESVPERVFSVEEIASQLKISPRTVRYYIDDFADTGFVEIVSEDATEGLKALPRLSNTECGLMLYKQGQTKGDNKVPYAERIPIKHIQRFYDVAAKRNRNEEDEKFVHELVRKLLYIGERTTVYSRGCAGRWIKRLNDLRQAASISEKIIAIDSLLGFIHGRGRIAPLVIKGSRSNITKLLDSVAGR